MFLVLGGLGLRSAVRLSRSALWASWADCLPMVFSRHRDVAIRFVVNLEGAPDTPSLGAAASAMWPLTGTMGFEPPSWRALAEGARPENVEPEDLDPGSVRRGWQHEAASRVDRHFREHVLFDRLPPRDRAQVRSQAGTGAGLALTALLTSYHTTKIPAHLFRVTLLRRLRLPLPLTLHMCRCCRPIDSFGHHRASCARSGVLGRGYALESAAARMCREAGGRVATNVLVRDMDLAAPDLTDSRRVVVDGLHLFGGCQLAVDTTLVCALHCDGSPHGAAADADGVVLQSARRRKERTYPELVGPLVRRDEIVCVTVGQSQGAPRDSDLAEACGAGVADALGAMLSRAAAKAVASSLLGLLCSLGSDGDTPSTWEVEGELRHVGLAP